MTGRIPLLERKFVSVEPNKCIGCSICEFVCALEKEGEPNPIKSRIRVIHLNPMFNIAVTCRFCEDAPCVRACPRDAIKQSEKGGILIIDGDKCDGCVLCVQACPYGGMMLDPDRGVAIACDLCNGEPKCVEFCPEEALKLVSEDEYFSKALQSTIAELPKEVEKVVSMIKGGKIDELFMEAEEKAKRIEEKLKALKTRLTVSKKAKT
ncbi:MAG: 4Fe-4S dicluster domain-containing protein [Candidatus Bathyarchaeia archaeon]|nr:4Fe-4S dicluster domain-containing protein [Candidatus Bathyarchaeota archaeon]